MRPGVAGLEDANSGPGLQWASRRFAGPVSDGRVGRSRDQHNAQARLPLARRLPPDAFAAGH